MRADTSGDQISLFDSVLRVPAATHHSASQCTHTASMATSSVDAATAAATATPAAAAAAPSFEPTRVSLDSYEAHIGVAQWRDQWPTTIRQLVKDASK